MKKLFSFFLLFITILPFGAVAAIPPTTTTTGWTYQFGCGRGGCQRSGTYPTEAACEAAKPSGATDCTGTDAPPATGDRVTGQATWTFPITTGRGAGGQSNGFLTQAACEASSNGATCTQNGPSVAGAGRGSPMTPTALPVASGNRIDYIPLVNLPFIGTGAQDIVSYLISILQLLIGIAGLVGVVRLVICGFGLLLAAGGGHKSDAKECIWKVVLGLLLAVSSFILLRSINPDLITPKFDPPATPTIPAGSPSATAPVSGCTGCVPVGVAAKTVAQNGCLAPGPCRITPALNTKLLNLATRVSGWWVTEAFPPTRPHQNPCHQNGSCVDADYTNNRTDAPSIIAFISAASASGLRAVYEVPTEGERQTLINGGVPAGNIQAVRGITGNHFSVYN